MRFAVGQIIVEQLAKLDLQYPKIDDTGRERLKEAKELLMKEK